MRWMKKQKFGIVRVVVEPVGQSVVVVAVIFALIVEVSYQSKMLDVYGKVNKMKNMEIHKYVPGIIPESTTVRMGYIEYPFIWIRCE